MRVPPLLQRLRAETRATHDRIEVTPGLAALITPGLTRSGYHEALRGKYRFHTLLQAVLPPRLARLGLDWPMPSHTLAALRADLATLGESAGSLAPPPSPPRVALGRGYAPAGALYVLEGSLLGGRVIGRHVQTTLGVSAARGGAFFCGTDTDAMRDRWHRFTALLAGLPPSAGSQVVAGALRGYAIFLACLQAPSGPAATLPDKLPASGARQRAPSHCARFTGAPNQL